MILIASLDNVAAANWREALGSSHEIYETNIHDLRSLKLTLKKVKVDLLILDTELIKQEGINEISELREIQPTCHIVAMAATIQRREEISAILFGAKAYCNINLDPKILPKVVTTVLANELWVDRKFVSRLLAEIEDITHSKHSEAKQLDKGVALLTPRENEIAALVATGASNRKIAERLSISERTVKAHLGVIFRKIGITDRLQLALYMNRHQQLSAIWHGKNDSH